MGRSPSRVLRSESLSGTRFRQSRDCCESGESNRSQYFSESNSLFNKGWDDDSEFTMAEIEHYVDPQQKDHPRFAEAEGIKLNLLAKDVQERGESTLTEMSIGDAVAQVCPELRSSKGDRADAGMLWR